MIDYYAGLELIRNGSKSEDLYSKKEVKIQIELSM